MAWSHKARKGGLKDWGDDRLRPLVGGRTRLYSKSNSLGLAPLVPQLLKTCRWSLRRKTAIQNSHME